MTSDQDKDMLGPELTQDKFLGGKVEVLQPAKAYRSGLDAVLLAAAVPIDESSASSDQRVLDAGAGVGVVGLCVAARCSNASIVLAEREPMLLELARRNIELNNFGDRVTALDIDVTAGGAMVHLANIELSRRLVGGFEHVVANPPFYDLNSTTSPNSRLKARAHQMGRSELDGWFRFLSTVAAQDASMTMIHRADALSDVLSACRDRFGALKLLPIHAHVGAPAIRILVQGRKGSRAPLSLLRGRVLHGDDKGYRREFSDILRDGCALKM